eukprot:CAMPEP_0114984048 /NCGR_PEP_ID=MMETSP0216-20121206/7053_1 /TAXON_ID=223996 /ORGANISM="Protocruzia adherens, Strain Boccale" /LENGTH=1008 /DNA_ID=CAMNT_0002346127 /DNA_START=389 /DNA_END=3415 /DNA_ORIENTATION=-
MSSSNRGPSSVERGSIVNNTDGQKARVKANIAKFIEDEVDILFENNRVNLRKIFAKHHTVKDRIAFAEFCKFCKNAKIFPELVSMFELRRIVTKLVADGTTDNPAVRSGKVNANNVLMNYLQFETALKMVANSTFTASIPLVDKVRMFFMQIRNPCKAVYQVAMNMEEGMDDDSTSPNATRTMSPGLDSRSYDRTFDKKLVPGKSQSPKVGRPKNHRSRSHTNSSRDKRLTQIYRSTHSTATMDDSIKYDRSSKESSDLSKYIKNHASRECVNLSYSSPSATVSRGRTLPEKHGSSSNNSRLSSPFSSLPEHSRGNANIDDRKTAEKSTGRKRESARRMKSAKQAAECYVSPKTYDMKKVASRKSHRSANTRSSRVNESRSLDRSIDPDSSGIARTPKSRRLYVVDSSGSKYRSLSCNEQDLVAKSAGHSKSNSRDLDYATDSSLPPLQEGSAVKSGVSSIDIDDTEIKISPDLDLGDTGSQNVPKLAIDGMRKTSKGKMKTGSKKRVGDNETSRSGYPLTSGRSTTPPISSTRVRRRLYRRANKERDSSLSNSKISARSLNSVSNSFNSYSNVAEYESISPERDSSLPTTHRRMRSSRKDTLNSSRILDSVFQIRDAFKRFKREAEGIFGTGFYKNHSADSRTIDHSRKTSIRNQNDIDEGNLEDQLTRYRKHMSKLKRQNLALQQLLRDHDQQPKPIQAISNDDESILGMKLAQNFYALRLRERTFRQWKDILEEKRQRVDRLVEMVGTFHMRRTFTDVSSNPTMTSTLLGPNSLEEIDVPQDHVFALTKLDIFSRYKMREKVRRYFTRYQMHSKLITMLASHLGLTEDLGERRIRPAGEQSSRGAGDERRAEAVAAEERNMGENRPGPKSEESFASKPNSVSKASTAEFVSSVKKGLSKLHHSAVFHRLTAIKQKYQKEFFDKLIDIYPINYDESQNGTSTTVNSKEIKRSYYYNEQDVGIDSLDGDSSPEVKSSSKSSRGRKSSSGAPTRLVYKENMGKISNKQ